MARGESMSSLGLEMALGAIFIIGIGIPVTNSVITDANLTGLSATVVGFAPVILAAIFLYFVAKRGGLLSK